MTNADRIRLLGETMYGARWQNAVARDLGINSRQVHRWVSGEYKPHDGHVRDLLAIAKERNKDMNDAIRQAQIRGSQEP